MPKTIEVSTALVTVTCVNTACGILYAVPEAWEQTRRRDHNTFYCPNGHHQYFPGQTEEEKLREQLAATERSLKWQSERRKQLADDNMTLAKSRRALRGVVTRLKNKALAGECAFCHHQFPDVATHVAEEHPGVFPDATEDDEAGG